MLALGMSLLMIVPIAFILFQSQSVGTYTVSYNANAVIVNPNGIELRIGNEAITPHWLLLMSSGNTTQLLTLGNLSVSRIINNYQNSVVVKGSNGNLRAAEIYSFSGNKISASIAIQNLNEHSTSFSTVFGITAAHSKRIGLIGYAPEQVGNGNAQFGSSIAESSYVPYSDFGASFGGVYLSWRSEMSIFAGGVASVSSVGNSVALDFGPFLLSPNETYTVDPTVSPMVIAPPPGGGGGCCYQAPTISQWGYTSNPYVGPGESYWFCGYVNPGGGANIQFQVKDYGSWSTVYSEYETSTNRYSYSFSYNTLSEYSASQVRILASNGYGSVAESSPNIYVSVYAPTTKNVSIYNSNGCRVGSYTMAVTVPGWAGQFTSIGPGSCGTPHYFNMNFGTGVEWNTNSIGGVWSIDQGITGGASPSYTSSQSPFMIGYGQYGYQSSSSNTFLIHLSEYLVGIANSFAFGLIPNPSWFYQPNNNGNSPFDQSAYWHNDSSSPTFIYYGCGYGQWYYYPLTYGSCWNPQDSKIWGIKTITDWFVSGNIPNYFGFVVYHVNVNLVESNDCGSLVTYGAASSLTVGVQVLNP